MMGQPDPLEGEAAFQFSLTDTATDAVQILQFLEVAHQRYLRSPYIREFTVNQLKGVENNDQITQANRIIDFVRSNLTYVQDPVDSEYVVSPVQLLQKLQRDGYMVGDCDDHVLLLNSMLGSIGINTKFIGVKFGNSDVFNHVVSGVQLGGHLYLVDPCSKFSAQPHYSETLIL
jgi:transglutaminase-like putative cysteine protease